MAKQTPFINILTYSLPYELSNQIYSEYQNRYKEAKYLIENYKTYKTLEKNLKQLELLLSLSIFHKRVMTNLDGAVKFYGTVINHSETETIKMGSYNFTLEEKNKILAVIINYQNLLKNFSISPEIMEYNETREFLKNIINLKSNLNNIGKRRKIEDDIKNQEGEDDLPF
jgi:hypothetical protein